SETELADTVKRAGLAGDPATNAIAMLYWAHWHATHRNDNQFAVSQESVFRTISTYFTRDDWAAVTRLAVAAFERTLAEGNAAGETSPLQRPEHAERVVAADRGPHDGCS